MPAVGGWWCPDAVDELGGRGTDVDLSWLPFQLPTGLRIVVSASEGAVEAQLRSRLPPEAGSQS